MNPTYPTPDEERVSMYQDATDGAIQDILQKLADHVGLEIDVEHEVLKAVAEAHLEWEIDHGIASQGMQLEGV
jgi:hypothetical protein